jgi:DNA-binding NtrC family response regulator
MSDPNRTAPLGETSATLRLTRGTLIVLGGAEAGRQVALEGGTLLIGSDPSAGLRLTEKSVSRRHAELALERGEFVLRDLGSTNGTKVNGTKIKEAFLEPGDLIALGACQLRFEPKIEEVRVPPSALDRFGPVFGASPVMRHVFGVLERVAPTDATVLIQGETGTGKDLLARAIHAASARRAGPFLVFDCSAQSPELVPAELFGHTEGAFTGASRKRRGVFEEAEGGTVFLDEIGELPLDCQPRLLRVLEAREVRPIGSNKPVTVDVRILAATHRDLAARVREGTFREDLYYRLAVVRVELPPLRQRPEDLPGLVKALLGAMKTPRGAPSITPAAVQALARHAWAGNVRELRNVLERSLALAGGATVDVADLMVPETPSPAPADSPRTLEDMESAAIRRALDETGGKLAEAAARLGIHRNTLREKIKKYGL